MSLTLLAGFRAIDMMASSVVALPPVAENSAAQSPLAPFLTQPARTLDSVAINRRAFVWSALGGLRSTSETLPSSGAARLRNMEVAILSDSGLPEMRLPSRNCAMA